MAEPETTPSAISGDAPRVVVVKTDAAGEVCFFASATTHVIVDLQGTLE